MRSARNRCLWLAVAVAGLVGCGVPGIPQPPSLNLPRAVTDLRAVRKGDTVLLVWTVPSETTDSLPVRRPGSTRICRSTTPARNGCETPVGEVATLPVAPQAKQKPAASKIQQNYRDSLPRSLLSDDPAAQFFYSVSVLNENGRSAGLSNVVQVPAVPALPAPADFRAEVTAEGIVLNWKGLTPDQTTPKLAYLYRVYRREDGSKNDSVVGEVALTPDAASRLVDLGFDWEKTYSYRATTVTLIRVEGQPDRQFEGDDTPRVKVFAHDVFPPPVPLGLQAVFSGAGQQAFIDLVWAPDTDADLAGYNIYRNEQGSQPVKINSELVKSPAFRDTNVVAEHTYSYSVSAVDVRENESARSAPANEEVP